jgi:hypothetical protein
LASGAIITLGRDAETGTEVAMKFEKHSIAPSLLEEEVETYQSLAGKTWLSSPEIT